MKINKEFEWEELSLPSRLILGALLALIFIGLIPLFIVVGIVLIIITIIELIINREEDKWN